MNQFVTTLDKESTGFNYYQGSFPKLSVAEVKAGVFVIKRINKDAH